MTIPPLTLTKQEQESLLQRFDEKNALYCGTYYEIGISCILCENYGCLLCPCSKIYNKLDSRWKGYPCGAILNQIKTNRNIITGFNYIHFNYFKKAVNDLQTIRDYIKQAKIKGE